MTETEAALYDAISAIMRTLTASGSINESALLSNLSEARDWAQAEGNRVRASILATLIQSAGEGGEWRFEADPPSN